MSVWGLHLGVSGCEDVVPEEGHFLLEGLLRVGHPVEPLHRGVVLSVGHLDHREVPVESVLVYVGLRLRVEHLLEYGVVPPLGQILQLGP